MLNYLIKFEMSVHTIAYSLSFSDYLIIVQVLHTMQNLIVQYTMQN